MNKKLYVVESVSVFQHTYYIRANSESDAADEFVCRKTEDTFMEGSQKYIDNLHTNIRELAEEDFIKEFDKENEYLQDWSDEQKYRFINEIDYS